jgi:hypothetical protein
VPLADEVRGQPLYNAYPDDMPAEGSDIIGAEGAVI